MEAIDNVERVNKLFPLPLRKAETDKTIIPKHPQSIDFEEIYIKVKRRMETDINISKSLPEQFSFVGSIYHVIRSKELSSEFMSNQTFPMIVVINKKTKELKLFSAELILDEMPDLLNEDK